MLNNAGKPIVCRRFEDTVTIVTGGVNGIGRAVVEALLAEGGQVACSDLQGDEQQMLQTLRVGAERCLLITGDMGDEDFCQDLIAKTKAHFGRIDFLVNNAFSFVAKSLNASSQDWSQTWNMGPVAFARMTQGVVPHMRQAGGGAIVNVSSISGWIAQKDRWTYNMSKGAVNQLTRCAALDLAEFGIRVNSISPGWIWSRQVVAAAEAAGGRDKWAPVWGKFHMLRRCGEVHECADAVLYLLSPQASFITGTDIAVDGGYRSMGPEGLGDMGLVVGSENTN